MWKLVSLRSGNFLALDSTVIRDYPAEVQAELRGAQPVERQRKGPGYISQPANLYKRISFGSQEHYFKDGSQSDLSPGFGGLRNLDLLYDELPSIFHFPLQI